MMTNNHYVIAQSRLYELIIYNEAYNHGRMLAPFYEFHCTSYITIHTHFISIFNLVPGNRLKHYIKRHARHLLECLGTLRLSLWAFQHQLDMLHVLPNAFISTVVVYSLLCANDFVQPPERQPQAPQLQHWQPLLHLLPKGVPASSPKPGTHGWNIGCKKQPLQSLCQGTWFCKCIKCPYFGTCCTCHVFDLHKSNSWISASTSTADHTWQQV